MEAAENKRPEFPRNMALVDLRRHYRRFRILYMRVSNLPALRETDERIEEAT
jgi:hypothetical protein